MHRLNSPLKVSCSQHPDRVIEAVDPRVSAEKQAYCVICMLENPQAHSLYQQVQTLPAFLNSIAEYYSNQKAQLKQVSDTYPPQHSQILSAKDEELCKISNFLSQEKKKIEEFFEELKRGFIDLLETKKAELCKLLDDQVANTNDLYASLEKSLKLLFPRKVDIDSLFPSREELENRFKNVENSPDLNGILIKMKNEVEEMKKNIPLMLQDDQSKASYLNLIAKKITQSSSLIPQFEIKNVQTLKKDLKKSIQSLLEPCLVLYKSTLIVDLLVVKEWLPDQYKINFTPRLIYKASRDGMTAKDFHSKCDSKGATITIVTCQFEGSTEKTVIGGFLDKDWHSKNNHIDSEHAFLFSLTSLIKCPYSGKGRVAGGYAGNGPVFGSGCDLKINYPSGSYVEPSSYTNSGQIIKSPIYKGQGRINFIPLEVEVYTVTP